MYHNFIFFPKLHCNHLKSTGLAQCSSWIRRTGGNVMLNPAALPSHCSPVQVSHVGDMPVSGAAWCDRDPGDAAIPLLTARPRGHQSLPTAGVTKTTQMRQKRRAVRCPALVLDWGWPGIGEGKVFVLGEGEVWYWLHVTLSRGMCGPSKVDVGLSSAQCTAKGVLP